MVPSGSLNLEIGAVPSTSQVGQGYEIVAICVEGQTFVSLASKIRIQLRSSGRHLILHTDHQRK